MLAQILVRYRGALPDLFREGHSVVAEGFVRPFDQYPGDLSAGADQHASLTAKAKESGCYFAAIEVLAKHDEVTPLPTARYDSQMIELVSLLITDTLSSP